MINIKICGITSFDALNTAVKSKVDYIGCVFFSHSPRNVNFELASAISELIPPHIKKVAVVVSPTIEHLKQINKHFAPDYFQIDGETTPEKIKEIKASFPNKIIKTIYVSKKDFLNELDIYKNIVDMILFEAKSSNSYFIDQPENTFDWQLLKNIDLKLPWILSGGLSRFNVKSAIRASNANIINASSTLEDAPGIKDTRLIEDFINASRSNFSNL